MKWKASLTASTRWRGGCGVGFGGRRAEGGEENEDEDEGDGEGGWEVGRGMEREVGKGVGGRWEERLDVGGGGGCLLWRSNAFATGAHPFAVGLGLRFQLLGPVLAPVAR